MSGVAPDPAAITDLIARLRHDGALEPEVALMGLEFRYLNDVADALEVLVARTTPPACGHRIASTMTCTRPEGHDGNHRWVNPDIDPAAYGVTTGGEPA